MHAWIERGSIDQFIVGRDRHFLHLEPVPLLLAPDVLPLHPFCEQTSTGLNWHFVLASSMTGTETTRCVLNIAPPRKTKPFLHIYSDLLRNAKRLKH